VQIGLSADVVVCTYTFCYFFNASLSYKDQFMLLSESMAKERQDLSIQEAAQSKVRL
jgi:hypothetical protein